MATYEDFSTQQFVRVSDIVKEPQKMLMPIAGYEDMPVVSLEEAVEPLVPILPRIRDYVYVAKQRCEAIPANNLTRDESSSIILYTMEWQPPAKCLYFALNATLRSENRRKLKPWFSYLKLILTALTRLPFNRHFAYRGVKIDISEQYPKGRTFIWWAFSSCTSSIETLENSQFLGKTGPRTLFTIVCNSGKNISRHSYYQLEEEILLLPARQFIVKACFQPAPDLHMVQLKEVEAPLCLLQPVAIDSNSNKSSSILSNKPIPHRLTGAVKQQNNSLLKANPHCPPDREINILLLGQTGVGKSTFINAFANYIVNDTLVAAVNDEMQVIIPSSFSFTSPDTFDERTIVMGNEDQYEQFEPMGQSCTQDCRTFVFPIGDRNLRFIDTPGTGDTRGREQDVNNFQKILSYIAQYEHLNAVFIMLKPNEERLALLFRFCINELLRHLNVAAKTNVVFVFTNARSNFFMPGSITKVLQELLDKHRRKHQVEVPFSKDNTFMFDNEPFRYLALCKNGVRLDNEQTQSYTKSWDHSVKEYSRLMQHISSCEPYAISNTLSLNEAEQLVRKLPRPIAETAKLIEENIQLAKEHKKTVLENPQMASQEIPQNNAVITTLVHPRTVCTGEKCCRVTTVGTERKVEYLSICHDVCYLVGVEQETLNNPKLQECEAIDPYKGFCKVCGCRWRRHKHITYECDTSRTHAEPNATGNTTTNKETSLTDIDKRIGALREEERQIQDVFKKLARFLHANSMLRINDEYIDYLQYFIREEQMKQKAGAHNTEVIASLEKMVTDYNNEMELFKKTLQDQRDADEEIQTLMPEEVLTLVGSLYRLPINGQRIREQVDGISIGQHKYIAHCEKFIELPAKAASSKLMLQLKDIVSRK